MRFKRVHAVLVVLAMATLAGAQTKSSGTAQCGKPKAKHNLEAGDRPNHSFMLTQVTCTWPKSFDIAGLQTKDLTLTVFSEVTGDSSQDRGIFVGAMSNGDKIYGRFHGPTTLKGGVAISAEAKWTYSGGTGKLKGIKGSGSAKGKGGPDGMTWESEGEYTLPK